MTDTRFLLSLTCLLVLGACQPEQVATAEDGLQACARIRPFNFDPDGHVDCRRPVPDASALTAEYRFGETSSDASSVTIDLIAPDGTRRQRIAIEPAVGTGLPDFRDLDSDGRADLLIPMPAEDENTPYQVWRGTDGAQPFVLAGTLQGMEVQAVGDGVFEAAELVDGDPDHTIWESGYYVFRDDQLFRVASDHVELFADDTSTCTVRDEGGLAGLGLTPETAQAKFCATD